jgi:hypothetical protein
MGEVAAPFVFKSFSPAHTAAVPFFEVDRSICLFF